MYIRKLIKAMENHNFINQAVRPDICRCCLSTTGCLDLSTPYITKAGSKEIFHDLLKECFGITLSCISEWDVSHLICTGCSDQLRDACSFKKQVLNSELIFQQYWETREGVTVKLEDDASPYFVNFDCMSSSPTHIGEKTEPNKRDAKKTVKSSKHDKEHRKVRKRRITSKITKREGQQLIPNSDCDSDTPISELSNKKEPSINEIGDDINKNECPSKNELSSSEAKDQITKTGQVPQEKVVKSISERKRVILTCNIVLLDTTACPFRHHKSWFQCFFCAQDFMEIDLLRHHTLLAHQDVEAELKKIKRFPRSLQIEISQLDCRICAAKLTDVTSLRRHFESAHSKIIYTECIADYKVNSSPYSCHLCNQEFHVFRTLTTHLNEHYANCICDVCGRSFLNSKRLKVHKRTHEKGDFPCTECGKVLNTKTSKANHMESAHSKRVIKCQICFKPMKHYNHRIKHMSEVHNITHKFRCHICSREYNIKHYLATHIRQTHGNKNKKCVTCGMAFITNHGLKKHMLKHTGERPFSCSICNKSYARSYTLRDHMRTHEGEQRNLPIPT